jgi:hypothetical protein
MRDTERLAGKGTSVLRCPLVLTLGQAPIERMTEPSTLLKQYNNTSPYFNKEQLFHSHNLNIYML